MTRRTGTYEVREDRLFVNGEPVGADRRVVREVLLRHQPKANGLLGGPIPQTLALKIIDQDRRIALVRLQAELHVAVA